MITKDQKWSTQLITNDQPNESQMINPTDHKRSTQWITNDQPNQSQTIKPTDHKRSTQLITENQPKWSQTINLTNHKVLTQLITTNQPNGSQRINTTDHKRSTQQITWIIITQFWGWKSINTVIWSISIIIRTKYYCNIYLEKDMEIVYIYVMYDSKLEPWSNK